jgi:hypothetical protein
VEEATMNRILYALMSFMVSLGLSSSLLAVEQAKSKAAGKNVSTMAEEDLIKLALSAAPERIAKDATVMVPGEEGKLKEVRIS